MLKAINSFKVLKYRQEIIYNSSKLLIINDSKSTTFSSSINLLKSYKNIYWLVGGLYKKGDSFKLRKENYETIRAYILVSINIFLLSNLIII